MSAEPPRAENPLPGAGQPAFPPPVSPQAVRLNFPRVRPVVTYVLVGLTVLVFLGQLASQYLLGDDWVALWLMKINELILSGQYWRLITPLLVHASLWHVGVNMYSLYILGPELEPFYGHGRFLVLYLLGGLGGNVLSFLLLPQASLGASTAIFGLLGAYAVFLYQHRELFGERARRALRGLVQVFALNLLISFSGRVDLWGHLGGLAGGVLFAWLAGPRLRVEGLFPNLKLVDEREAGDTARAALIVGTLFVVAAGAAIYLRGGLH